VSGGRSGKLPAVPGLLLFAGDMSMCAGVGKFPALPCSGDDKRKTLSRNLRTLPGE